jgi:hypothetical protein
MGIVYLAVLVNWLTSLLGLLTLLSYLFIYTPLKRRHNLGYLRRGISGSRTGADGMGRHDRQSQPGSLGALRSAFCLAVPALSRRSPGCIVRTTHGQAC